MLISMVTGSTFSTAEARQLDAGFVVSEMPTEQRYAFVQGVMSGLAYARFQKDKPNEKGMACIQNWLNKDTDKRWARIEGTFKKYEDKPPAALLFLLTKKECGA